MAKASHLSKQNRGNEIYLAATSRPAEVQNLWRKNYTWSKKIDSYVKDNPAWAVNGGCYVVLNFSSST